MNTKGPTQIGMREFLRNTKKIKAAVARGEEFEVLDRTTPAFRIVPAGNAKIPAFKREDIFADVFFGGPADLATEVDHYLYDAPKKTSNL